MDVCHHDKRTCCSFKSCPSEQSESFIRKPFQYPFRYPYRSLLNPLPCFLIMSLVGVHQALLQAENDASTETVFDVELELEDISEDYNRTSHSVSNREDDAVQTQASAPVGFQQILTDFTVEVAEGTDANYRRYMAHFDVWLQKGNYIANGETIFTTTLRQDTPFFIIAWIMSQCDVVNPDGTVKDQTSVPSTYTHATKLRSALTYGFGRQYDRGNREWKFSQQSGQWEGNPSVSIPVARYLVALRKRKHAAGDRYAMSSRAITSDTIRKMYAYNLDQGRTKVEDFPSNRPRDEWGNPRRRLLVNAAVTLAFVCLLRLDEVLNLRFEDITFHSEEHIEISLSSRKTHQFGGSKPYHLWKFREEDEAFCPLLALANWINVSGLSMSTGYIFRAPGQGGSAPSLVDQPISSSAFIELFRNNLVDVGIDGSMYGGHSCRRGGCQWLIRDLRWSILRICDWGGWSKDFSHSSIIKYLFSWNDDPYEAREDYFNPRRAPNKRCTACGRNCWC